MILIADSGSTKTEWCLVNTKTGSFETCHTSGINPLYQDAESIRFMLETEFSLRARAIRGIFFYGAGCINDHLKDQVRRVLDQHFRCHLITVRSDLMAAARSLCQNQEGMACILGTGSNSCYYNGHEIVRHVSPLGYILGDEGSGAVMGKKLLSDILKRQLPDGILDRFFAKYKLSTDTMLESVYKKPYPNRFLAQFAPFIQENLQEESLRNLVKKSFHEFFDRNIRQYPEAVRLPVDFTGSIAWHFRAVLQESARESGFQTGKITLKPMEGLIDFHIHNKPE
jgi:N-acetylglucosamine kinase-like BadF-type ATPase